MLNPILWIFLPIFCNRIRADSPTGFKNMGFFLAAAGLMMIFEGIPFFCFPVQYKEWLSKVPEIPNSTLRTIGLVIMILGLGLVYVGKSLMVS